MTLTPVSPTEVIFSTDVVPQEVVDALAAELRQLRQARQLELALEYGRRILEAFYDGDMAQMEARDPHKEGLRALAAHPDIVSSHTTLHGYIKVYDLVDRVENLRRAAERQALSYSHFREAARVPDREQQEKLLLQAAEKGWSVRELAEEAEPFKPQRPGGPKKRVRTQAAKVVAAFTGVHRKQRGPLGSDDLLEGVTPKAAKQLAGRVATVIEALEALKARLEAVEETPDAPEPVVPTAEPVRPDVAPPSRPAPSPAATARAPVARKVPAQPKPKPSPVLDASMHASVERRLEANAGMCWKLVQEALIQGIPRDRLVRAITRRTRVSEAFAERVALLADLPDEWHRRLEAMARPGVRSRTLTQILQAAELE